MKMLNSKSTEKMHELLTLQTNMKLYLTLEDGKLKEEKVLSVDENTVTFHERFGNIIEDMFNEIIYIKKYLKEEEIILENRRLTGTRN